jgi:hypothetical protein
MNLDHVAEAIWRAHRHPRARVQWTDVAKLAQDRYRHMARADDPVLLRMPRRTHPALCPRLHHPRTRRRQTHPHRQRPREPSLRPIHRHLRQPKVDRMTGATMTRPTLSRSVNNLRAAIRALTEPHYTRIDGATYQSPSLYQQMIKSIPGEQGSGGHASRSMPPLWCDALDLLADIDHHVAIWLPLHDETTENRLACLLRLRKWKQHDIEFLDPAVTRLRAWERRINELLTPVSVKTISAPCPACSATTAYRKDSAGETVRGPALQVITNLGCTCLVCHTHWAPEYYLFLCGLLEFDLPAGVLE